MDREKRRTVEEEEEIDRKIALIREKNQRIEQRAKEIEEDRALNGGENEKTPKPAAAQQSNATAGAKKGNNANQWSREWDKGKTPADTWRENVPSIDLKGKLASQKHSNNGKPKNHQRKDGEGNHARPKIPNRLEGRITFTNNAEGDKQHGKKSEKKEGGKEVPRDRKHHSKPHQTLQQPNHNDGSKGHRRRNQEQKRGGEGKEKEKKETSASDDVQKAVRRQKPRNRRTHESDNYAVKKVVRGMVEKICWLERLEKRKQKKALGEKEITQKEEADEAGKKEEKEEVRKSEDARNKEEEKKDVEGVVEMKAENEKEIPTEKKTNDGKDDAVENGEKKSEESERIEKNEKIEEDANQNVISLVQEKVVTMTTSQVS
ncbi:unnamed protein product [Caenorhabditis bovis]|uniref:Uncharacterized protein n=1 Tax=Caenorhabditis bovis TaxID=2654633 RepID=A0A8S1EJA9_9PELO|nr:unnamed protein product [Caenorhabditis bovis]